MKKHEREDKGERKGNQGRQKWAGRGRAKFRLTMIWYGKKEELIMEERQGEGRIHEWGGKEKGKVWLNSKGQEVKGKIQTGTEEIGEI